MHKDAFDRLIREKLADLALPYPLEGWEQVAAMLDHRFDARIKERLTHLSFTTSPDDWKDLAQRLDERFDSVIRARLQTLSIEEAPQDWPVLSALLEGRGWEAKLIRRLLSLKLHQEAPNWPIMLRRLEDDEFLSYLREQLDGIQLQNFSEGWATQQVYLDQEFDHQVRKALENHELSSADTEWDQLEARLPSGQFDQSLRSKIDEWALQTDQQEIEKGWVDLANKLELPFDKELANSLNEVRVHDAPDWDRMKALLLPEPTPSTFRWQRFASAAAVLLLLFMSGSLWWRSGEQLPTRVKERLVQVFGSQNQQEALLVSKEAPEVVKSDPRLSSSTVNVSAPRPSSLSIKVGAVDQLGPSDRQSVELVAPIDPTEAIAMVMGREGNEGSQSTYSPNPTGKAFKIAPLQSKLRGSSSLSSPYMSQKRTMEMLLPPDKYPPEIRVGLMASLTRTKAELSGPLAESGNAIGIRFEQGINQRWQLISGLVYGQKRFAHEYPEQVGSKTLTHRVEAEMRMVEIPLMMRYRFPSDNNKLSLYGQGGILASISLSESYVHYDPTTPVNTLRTPIQPEHLQANNSEYNLNPYPANIIVGLGLEYELTKRIALQVEPYFVQNLQRTRGSSAVGLEKKLSSSGVSGILIFDLFKD